MKTTVKSNPKASSDKAAGKGETLFNSSSPIDSSSAEVVPVTYLHGDRVIESFPKLSLLDKLETFVAQLSTKNNFWNRICSWIWLPFAFRSGIRMHADGTSFTAVLPFSRFNKNWYNAMAGAVLLGNSEIAGGTYVFKACGGKYRVVCKDLQYRFLRPCVGPALYRMTPKENIDELVASGKEFNITLDMSIVQLMRAPQERECRVGRCSATFHASPILQVPKNIKSKQLAAANGQDIKQP